MNENVLERPTLVLNRNWQPVNVATVARALVLLWNESARVVDRPTTALHLGRLVEAAPRDGEAFIQAISMRLRVPEVIALPSYDRLPASAVTFSRRNIFKRDHYACQYCGSQPGTRRADDRPRRAAVAGWRVDLGRTACWRASTATSARPTARRAQAGMKLRKQPIRPTWKPVYADHHVRIESWSKFVSEAYWNVELAEVTMTPIAPGAQVPGALTRVCSWESSRPPKPPHGVRILALVLVPTWLD